MPTFDYDLIVLGGGSAGLSLANVSSRFGAKVALVDAGNLGGDCLHYGCVPSKSLIHAAKIAHSARTAQKYGVHAGDVSVDFQAVLKRVHDVIGTIHNHADSPDRYRKLGCDVWTETKGTFVDEHTIDVGDMKITGKKIAICVGTRPATLPVPGLEDVGYLTNETVFYTDKQPKSMIIIGSGPIGCEMAQAFQRLGTQVTLVNRSDRIMGKEDKDVQDFMREVFTKEGMELQLGVDMKSARKEDDQKVFVVEKDGKEIELKADEILVAIGRTSNADSLQVSNAGIILSDKGYIQVDSRLRSNHKHIYAAGDVTGHLQFTHSAGYEAGVVFQNALLHIPKKVDLNQIPWATFTDPEVASCGLNEAAAQKKGVEYKVATFDFSDQDRALAEGENHGFIKVLLGKKNKVIGCQIVGPHAGELIHEWIVGMAGGMKLSDMGKITHVYPTLAGANQQVAGQYLGEGFLTPKTRKWTRKILGLRNTKIDA